ncbi:MAG: PAS domain-containing protein [Verrucomicrobia bacterium]|nr:PAS domain-containing protein [Verrucomicrobiota bacterium]
MDMPKSRKSKPELPEGAAGASQQALINSVNFAILILGSDGRIRRFTPVAGRLFNLIPADVGRPFTDISSNLQIPDLSALVDQVVETMSPIEAEVQKRAGRWYKLTIRPYRTGDNKIEGAILALVDIDILKRSLEETRQSRDFAEAVVATIRQPPPLTVSRHQLGVRRQTPVRRQNLISKSHSRALPRRFNSRPPV